MHAGIMVGMGLAGRARGATPAAWFIIIFRSKSIDATRESPRQRCGVARIRSLVRRRGRLRRRGGFLRPDLRDVAEELLELSLRGRAPEAPQVAHHILDARGAFHRRAMRSAFPNDDDDDSKTRANSHAPVAPPPRATRRDPRPRTDSRGLRGSLESRATCADEADARRACANPGARGGECRPQAPTASRQIKCRGEAPC